MKDLVMIIRESINFKRGQSSMDSIGLGMKNYMGFSSDFKGIEFNDGNRNMYISKSFGYEIFEDREFKGAGWERLKDGYSGRYGRAGMGDIYKCNYLFRLLTFGDGESVFFVAGSSGSHGFNAGQTKKETLGKRIKKSLYDQLYNHLLIKLPRNVIQENLNFERGLDSKKSLNIGEYSQKLNIFEEWMRFKKVFSLVNYFKNWHNDSQMNCIITSINDNDIYFEGDYIDPDMQILSYTGYFNLNNITKIENDAVLLKEPVTNYPE